MRVSALVLAAGSSQRMGTPKALLEIDDQTFLERIVERLLEGGVSRVVVVTGGDHAEEIEEAVKAIIAKEVESRVALLHNRDPEEGPVSSVRVGIRSEQSRVEGVLIHPVDIPRLESDDVSAILSTAEAMPEADAVIPSVEHRRGHPLFLRIPAALKLLDVDSPATVRELLRLPDISIEYVLRENRGLLKDIDTPEDYHSDISQTDRD